MPNRANNLIVAVPARDEATHVAVALASICAAADRITSRTGVHIVVAADSCHDDTADVARAVAVLDPRITVVEGTWGSAGGARRAAVAVGLETILDRTNPVGVAVHIDSGVGIGNGTWIATTDADTVVPLDWLTRQLDFAAAGIDAVAGIVDLRRDDDWSIEVDAAFARMYHVGPSDHGHVHGANMGMRADAYLHVGGFWSVLVAEDHLVWDALRAAGFRCVASSDLVVSTSARRHGRAPGGFADTFREFIEAAD